MKSGTICIQRQCMCKQTMCIHTHACARCVFCVTATFIHTLCLPLTYHMAVDSAGGLPFCFAMCNTAQVRVSVTLLSSLFLFCTLCRFCSCCLLQLPAGVCTAGDSHRAQSGNIKASRSAPSLGCRPCGSSDIDYWLFGAACAVIQVIHDIREVWCFCSFSRYGR